MQKGTFIWYLLMVILVWGCSTSQNISKYNFARLYKGTEQVIKPEFTAFHVDEKKTNIHFQINSTGLVYAKPQNGKDYRSKAKLMYIMYESFSSNIIVDSASFLIQDINNEKTPKLITGTFTVPALYPKKYVLRVIIKDENKDWEEEKLLELDKTSRANRQNYLVTYNETHLPLMKYQTQSESPIRIQVNNSMVKRLIVKYYDRPFPLSPPPFISHNPKRFDFTPDSFYYVNLNDSNFFVTQFKKTGLYHIQTDSTAVEGLTIYKLPSSAFPSIKKHEEMIPAIRFISTNREFKEIVEHEDQREAMESYWLDRTSSPNKSRELIRVFYGRIELANEYFTSHLEGWKSDRGLIYTIYGPPQHIYRTAGSESWIYGSGKSKPSLTFNFTKTFNPFSDNDYRLNRSPEYKSTWYNAVDTWRQGRVYEY